ncbi:MAG TPA: hypothetical protein DCO86_02275, partial [Spirochaetaceae bacterium]|nr:hypothetical protein [Spirochaetaceae bacterium]
MISEMKKVYILTKSDYRKKALLTLRSTGMVHISDKPASFSTDSVSEKKRLADIVSVCNWISDAKAKIKSVAKKHADGNEVFGLKFAGEVQSNDIDCIVSESAGFISEYFALKSERKKVAESLDYMNFWGDFDVSLLEKVRNAGIDLTFAEIDRSKEAAVLEAVDGIRIREVSKTSSVFAVLADADAIPSGVKTYRESAQSVSDLLGRLTEIDGRMRHIDEFFESLVSIEASIQAKRKEVERNLNLLFAIDSFSMDGELVHMTGFIPSSCVAEFEKILSGHGEIGYCICDVEPDDEPPTLLRNGSYSSMLKPVIDILGLFPGYRERDISFWFLSFFAIFFALIIGDAVYGSVFLIFGIALACKGRSITNTSGLLIMLGLCTVVWGAMTGTYLGSELVLESSPFLRRLVVPAFASFPSVFSLSAAYTQNSIMRLCFTIGALQLILACAMNVISKARKKDLSMFADVGWYMIIQSLYFVVLYLLIKGKLESDMIENRTNLIIGLIAFGFGLIVVFGGQAPGKSFAQGLKSGLADLFTTFLNVISAFGNIMSYIRLFAVGMASVAIAGSFNQIARNFYSGALFAVAAVILA